MMATLAEQLARRVRVAAGPHDNPDMSVQQVVSAMADRIAAQKWILEQCQQILHEHSEAYVELDAYLRGDIDNSEVLAIKAEHEAALAQQGKGNADG